MLERANTPELKTDPEGSTVDSQQQLIPVQQLDDLYTDAGQWAVNAGENKVYAKRMPGRWRRIKSWTSSVWLVFFLGPYLNWEGRQAVLFDLPAQQFHLFGLTVLPQDLWILAAILLFFAILLAVATAIAGRVFCGFFCFQTVWTDWYVWLEEQLEGAPRQRKIQDANPWSAALLCRKVLKHAVWLLIALLTGVSFIAWFMDSSELWRGLLKLSLPMEAWVTLGLFTLGTYSLAGFMREQTCLWLCPYARIQGVMIDNHSLLPSYDIERGEPRQRISKHDRPVPQGDCIDCNLCVAVCPTGIDIRQGQQPGCITCGLCLDACDHVMDKISRPRGLIRYASLSGLSGDVEPPWYARSRVWVYLGILAVSFAGGAYGLATLDGMALSVIQHRQPLYVLQSDGAIQNRYRVKILNKTAEDLRATISLSAPAQAQLIGADQPVLITAFGITARDLFVRLPAQAIAEEKLAIAFNVRVAGNEALTAERKSVFIAPPSLRNDSSIRVHYE